jgi:hypothetical protein
MKIQSAYMKDDVGCRITISLEIYLLLLFALTFCARSPWEAIRTDSCDRGATYHMRWMKVQLTILSPLSGSWWVGGNVVARGAYGPEIYSCSGKDFLHRNFGKD